MTKRNNKSFNIFTFILIIAIQLPILIKVVTDFFLSTILIKITSLNQLLPISETAFFNNEFLFKLAIAFSDFNFDFIAFINLISIFDILPILSIILFLEVNRITKKSKHIKRSLIAILLVYLLKYLGIGFILMVMFTKGLPFHIGFVYLGYLLMFIGIAFLMTMAYLLFSYNSFSKLKII